MYQVKRTALADNKSGIPVYQSFNTIAAPTNSAPSSTTLHSQHLIAAQHPVPGLNYQAINFAYGPFPGSTISVPCKIFNNFKIKFDFFVDFSFPIWQMPDIQEDCRVFKVLN